MRVARTIVRVALLLATTAVVGALLWARRDISRVSELIRHGQDPVPQRALRAVIAVESPGDPVRRTRHTAARLERAVVAACSRWRMCGPTGGATLTEQIVARRIEGRPISRLARQLIVAVVVDLRFDAHEIATAYCNTVYLGGRKEASLHGLRAASSAYFRKAPEELTVGQVAAVVADIRSPAAFSPAVRTDRAAARRRTVLRTFVAAGVATSTEIIQAERELAAQGL